MEFDDIDIVGFEKLTEKQIYGLKRKLKEQDKLIEELRETILDLERELAYYDSIYPDRQKIIKNNNGKIKEIGDVE